MLDTEADIYAWTKITPEPSEIDPLPRGGATMTVVQGRIWMFGGQDPLSGISFADFVVLDPSTWSWSRPQMRGEPPPSRHSHVAGVCRDRLVVVYGGAGTMGTLGDVWLFDTEALVWSRPSISGPTPPAREMAAGCMLAGDRLFVHGGRGAQGQVLSDVAILDLEQMRWVVLQLTPYPRCAHTVVALQVVYGDEEEQQAENGSHSRSQDRSHETG